MTRRIVVPSTRYGRLPRVVTETQGVRVMGHRRRTLRATGAVEYGGPKRPRARGPSRKKRAVAGGRTEGGGRVTRIVMRLRTKTCVRE